MRRDGPLCTGTATSLLIIVHLLGLGIGCSTQKDDFFVCILYFYSFFLYLIKIDD